MIKDQIRAKLGGGFFDDLGGIPEPPNKPRRNRASGGKRLTPIKARPPANPCAGCPREHAVKVPPVLPPTATFVCVGIAPGDVEERRVLPFQGPSGELLREGLALANLTPDNEGYANLARCRPENDDLDSKEWARAEKICYSGYLQADLAALPPSVPLLLLGARAVAKMLGVSTKDVTLGAYRGLWIKTQDGRMAYVARHPAGVLRAQDPKVRAALKEQFISDIARFASRLRGTESRDEPHVRIFKSPFDAKPFLTNLAVVKTPWAFDIETFDAKETPSRQWVSTDPCHPDFRVRGVAIAVDAKRAAWIELMGHEAQLAKARALLSPAFASPAEKWAYFGHFDEEGLVYPGWIDRIVNRLGDGALAQVALSDGRRAKGDLRLERAVVDLLKLPQYWDGLSKGHMRIHPIEQVARGAGLDACRTWLLCQDLHARLAAGRYFGEEES